MKNLLVILLILTLAGCAPVQQQPPVQQQSIIPAQTTALILTNLSNSTDNETIEEIIPPLIYEEGKLNIFLLYESNATLILLPNGKNILIDAGDENSVYTILGRLQNLNKKVDYLILTYPSTNKIQGAPYITMRYLPTIYETGIPSNLREYALYHQYSNNITKLISRETSLIEGDVIIRLIPPYEDSGFFIDAEQNTLIVKVIYGELTYLQMDGCHSDCQDKFIDLKAEIIFTRNSKCPFFKTDFILNALPTEIISLNEKCQQLKNVNYLNINTTILNKDYLIISDGKNVTEGFA